MSSKHLRAGALLAVYTEGPFLQVVAHSFSEKLCGIEMGNNPTTCLPHWRLIALQHPFETSAE